jgi:hypothetical protein
MKFTHNSHIYDLVSLVRAQACDRDRARDRDHDRDRDRDQNKYPVTVAVAVIECMKTQLPVKPQGVPGFEHSRKIRRQVGQSWRSTYTLDKNPIRVSVQSLLLLAELNIHTNRTKHKLDTFD